MGNYASKFHNSGGKFILEETDPSQSNWITLHAETCKLSIPEVLRCWSRFLLLHPDSNGNIKRSQLCIKDVYGEKLLKQVPEDRNELITFQAYCSAVSWLAKAPQESKLRGLYQTLTSSTLNKDSLRDLLCHLYPNEEPNVLSDLCHLLFSEIDRENKGSIHEDQVVSWVQGLPQAHVLPVLDFPILPPAITSAQERVLPYTLTSTDLDDHGRIPDKQLHQVALLMAKRRRDWRLLANHLGFLEKDCIFFDKKHFEASEKILDMLQVWRNASGKQAQSKTLQNALKQTNNSDIANEVFNLNF
ncbi:uncharacterized protein PAF06_015257 [Gastrophryne carolinensis]